MVGRPELHRKFTKIDIERLVVRDPPSRRLKLVERLFVTHALRIRERGGSLCSNTGNGSLPGIGEFHPHTMDVLGKLVPRQGDASCRRDNSGFIHRSRWEAQDRAVNPDKMTRMAPFAGSAPPDEQKGFSTRGQESPLHQPDAKLTAESENTEFGDLPR
jgi:hypothetical protein